MIGKVKYIKSSWNLSEEEADVTQPRGQEMEDIGCASFLQYFLKIHFVLQFALLYCSCYMDTPPTDFLWPFYFLFFIFLPVSKFNLHVGRLKQCSQIHCAFHISWSLNSQEQGLIPPQVVCDAWLLEMPPNLLTFPCSQSSEPHSCANQLQTASWFLWM